MRTLIRLFFRTLHLLLAPLMLLWAKLAMPKGMVREAAAQQAVDLECSRMALYHYPTCPFCIKVLHEMGRLSLPIELRDAQHDAAHRETLLQEGGKVQVPCLRISDAAGQVQWLYESSDIVRHLQQRFG